MSSTTEQVQKLEQQQRSEIAVYRQNTQNTHKRVTTSSVGRILLRIWDKFHKNETEKECLWGLLVWVNDLAEYFEGDALVEFRKNQTTFIAQLMEFAQREQGELDEVDIYNPETKETKAVVLRLWKALWCLTRAISDDAGFINSDYTRKDRHLGMYNLLRDFFNDPHICNVGVRNDLTRQLLHQQYRLTPDAPLVYVVTTVGSDVFKILVQHYADAMHGLVTSPEAEVRYRGLQLTSFWIDDHANLIKDDELKILREFQGDEKKLTQKIIDYFHYLGVDVVAEKILPQIDDWVQNRTSLPVPEPVGFVNAVQILTTVRSAREKHAQSFEVLKNCRCLSEVPVLTAPIKRIALLDRIDDVCDIIPFGQHEGALLTVGQRIRGQLVNLASSTDYPTLFKTVSDLEDELEEAVTRARLDDDGGAVIANSFAILKKYQKDSEAFREKLEDFVQRTKGILSNERLRQFLKSQIEVKKDVVGLNLSPLGVNSIIMHAIRVSPINWSVEFIEVFNMLLVQLKKEHKDTNKKEWIRSSYPPLLIAQLEWLLRLANDRVIEAIPSHVYMPCNLAGLRFASESFPKYEREVSACITPLQRRGWWYGLPNEWCLLAIPHITVRHLVAIFEIMSSPQVLDEFKNSLVRYADRPEFLREIFPHLKRPLRWKVLLILWDRVDAATLLNLASTLRGDLQEFITAVTPKIKTAHQVFALFVNCFDLNSRQALDFLKQHRNFIQKTVKARHFLQAVDRMSHTADALIGAFEFLVELKPEWSSDLLELVGSTHATASLERIPVFYQHYFKRIKLFDCSNDASLEVTVKRYCDFLSQGQKPELVREFFKLLPQNQHRDLIPKGISVRDYIVFNKISDDALRGEVLLQCWKDIRSVDLPACLKFILDKDFYSFLMRVTPRVTRFCEANALIAYLNTVEFKSTTKLAAKNKPLLVFDIYMNLIRETHLNGSELSFVLETLHKNGQTGEADKEVISAIEKHLVGFSTLEAVMLKYQPLDADDAVAFVKRHLLSITTSKEAVDLFVAYQVGAKTVSQTRASRLHKQDELAMFAMLASHIPDAEILLLASLGDQYRHAAMIAKLAYQIEPFCTEKKGLASYTDYRLFMQTTAQSKSFVDVLRLWANRDSNKYPVEVTIQLRKLNTLAKLDKLQFYSTIEDPDAPLPHRLDALASLPQEEYSEATQVVMNAMPEADSQRCLEGLKSNAKHVLRPHYEVPFASDFKTKMTETKGTRQADFFFAANTNLVPCFNALNELDIEDRHRELWMKETVVHKESLRLILLKYNAEKGFLRRKGWFHHAKRTDLVGDLWDLFELPEIHVIDIVIAFQKRDGLPKPKNSRIESCMDCLNQPVILNHKHSATDRVILAISELLRVDARRAPDDDDDCADLSRNRMFC